MKPRVKINGRSPYGEWEPGDTGVVDGYCRGGNDVTYAVVILNKNFRFVMVNLEQLELIKDRNMKYIDAERLRKEVKRLEKAVHKAALGCADSETRKFHEGKDFAYQYVGILIDSLQQEQPEVDLEKVLSGFTGYYAHENSGEYPSAIDIARHFFNLGLNARKEE